MLTRKLIPTRKKAFEDILGREENAGNLLFPCFLPLPKGDSIFQPHLFLWSANVFNLNQSKVLSFGTALEVKTHVRF